MSTLSRLHQGWRRLTRLLWPLGWLMTALLMNAVFVLLLPFTLIRLRDPLRLRRTEANSNWVERAPAEPTVERHRHPF